MVYAMKIFLAGGITGNLNPAWRRIMRNEVISYEAFMEALIHEGFIGEIGKSILDIEQDSLYNNAAIKHRPYILESFFYSDIDMGRILPYLGDFMLDSGAFTFIQSRHNANIDWDDYIERYADFIKRNDIKKFFELDIDSVIGYERVRKFRKKLENLSNRQCIPVWHKSRGIDEFKRICDEYEYAAIGGVVTKEIKPKEYDAFPYMIREAHKRGCRLHGLGFTNLQLLPKTHFDSVDSTAWTTGNRFGFIYKFDGMTMKKYNTPRGMRLADSRKVAFINYTEWIKFQKYAEVNL